MSACAGGVDSAVRIPYDALMLPCLIKTPSVMCYA